MGDCLKFKCIDPGQIQTASSIFEFVDRISIIDYEAGPCIRQSGALIN